MKTNRADCTGTAGYNRILLVVEFRGIDGDRFLALGGDSSVSRHDHAAAAVFINSRVLLRLRPRRKSRRPHIEFPGSELQGEALLRSADSRRNREHRQDYQKLHNCLLKA